MHLSEEEKIEVDGILVLPVAPKEEDRFCTLMERHHYLGALPKIGESIWYVASYGEQWIALLCFSAAALKCSARDQWIGWGYRHQYDRLHLLANNSRFLILPQWHRPNLATRILSLCRKRLSSDWQARYGHPLLLLETFVDPERYAGTIYKADNWHMAGLTRGFRRTVGGYTPREHRPKMIFLHPLRSNARMLLSQPFLGDPWRHGRSRIMLTAQDMRDLPAFFRDIPDPRRGQGLRHSLATTLSIAAAATLCGQRGYSDISDWAQSLTQRMRSYFRCRKEDGKYVVPSTYVIRDLLIRVDPGELDRAIQCWNAQHAPKDKSLAIDGKTMRGAISRDGDRTHIMSVIGHDSGQCFTQKK